jgi:CheY-like chemotaxis protein/HPt (histidine-containing phosphotransfer) domain-containing protein
VIGKINGARILLVDDNAFNVEVAADFLHGAGALVTTCGNGKEALELLKQHRFDCVLMDVQMPVMDGVDAVRLMRADPQLHNVRVIGLTANASREDKERYLSAGMNDVIVKPFKYQTLFTTLARWLPQQSAGDDGVEQALAVAAARMDAVVISAELKGDPEIIDLSILAEMTDNDQKRFTERARSFAASLDKDMVAIEDALKRKDLQALGALGHYCKTPARTVGAIGYADLCQALEDNAHDGSLERAQNIVSGLHLLLSQIKKRIAKALS